MRNNATTPDDTEDETVSAPFVVDLDATERQVTITEDPGAAVTIRYPNSGMPLATDPLEIVLASERLTLTLEGYQVDRGIAVNERGYTAASAVIRLVVPGDAAPRQRGGDVDHHGNMVPRLEGSPVAPLANLHFTLADGDGDVPITLLDPQGVLGAFPTSVGITGCEVVLEGGPLQVRHDIPSAQRISIHPSSVVELTEGRLRLEDNIQPVTEICVRSTGKSSLLQRASWFTGDAKRIEIDHNASCGIGVGSTVDRVSLGGLSELVVEPNSSINLVNGFERTDSTVSIASTSKDVKADAADFGWIVDCKLRFHGNRPHPVKDEEEVQRGCVVRGGVQRLTVSKTAGEHTGFPPVLEFDRFAVARDLEFVADSSIAVRAKGHAVLSGVTGEFTPVQMNGTTIRGEADGFRLAFDEVDPDHQPLRDAELDGVIIPAALQANTIRTLKSLETARAVTPHNASWRTGTHLGIAARAKVAILSVATPVDQADEMSHLIDVSELTTSKARDAATRCEAQIAALNARQIVAASRTERSLLLGGRILGYGLRVWRPVALLLGIALIGLIWTNHDSQFQPFDVGNIGTFLWQYVKHVLSPLSLLPGVSAADTASALGAVPLGERIGLSIPFATILVAIRNRARWRNPT